MSQHADTVIIGGGLIGLLTAHQLASHGQRVIVLERQQPGRESSWAGGGILSPLYPWRYADAITDLARWSQYHYPSLLATLQQQSGIDPEFQPSGLLMMDLSDEEIDAAHHWAAQTGYLLETVNTARCQTLQAGIAARSGAIWMPTIGQVRNPRLMQSLVAAATRMGVEIRHDTAAERWITSGTTIKGVETATHGQMTAERFILCSGAWSGEISAQLGICLPIAPIRGQMLLFRANSQQLQRIVLANDRYLIPRRDGRILIGSTLEESGFDKQTTSAARESLQAAAIALLPALANYPIEHHWAGLRPATPSGVPIIGRVSPFENLYLNAGHFRNGVVMGYASVRLLCDLVLKERPIVDPAPYAPALWQQQNSG
jgi:glycine oxidase